MDVILSLDKFPILSKTEINNGNIPPNGIIISNFLRSIFLLSNTLLHENNLILYCSNQFSSPPKGLIIYFYGANLRYLAPDERETLFLLLKIHKIITGEGGKKQEKKESEKFQKMQKAQSTPGTYVIRGGWEDIWSVHKSQGKTFVYFGETAQGYSELINFTDLENIVNAQSVLVFKMEDQLFNEPPLDSKVYSFIDISWKAKFYQSELISYIQAKITQ